MKTYTRRCINNIVIINPAWLTFCYPSLQSQKILGNKYESTEYLKKKKEYQIFFLKFILSTSLLFIEEFCVSTNLCSNICRLYCVRTLKRRITWCRPDTRCNSPSWLLGTYFFKRQNDGVVVVHVWKSCMSLVSFSINTQQLHQEQKMQ